MAYARGYGGYGGHSVSNYGNGAYGYADSSVNFCPAGLGYPQFCPRPDESFLSRYCCQEDRNGFYYGGCCVLPIGVGWFIAILAAGILLLSAVTYWCCTCIPSCRLAKRFEAKRLERLNRRQSVSLSRRRSSSTDGYGVIQKEVQSQAYYAVPTQQSY
ncbi:hypothetical protein AAVH_37973 [Aphelenchoides avenae]|nr:hypothetical protein AAVH_37973 [Aphelenchus avenae]